MTPFMNIVETASAFHLANHMTTLCGLGTAMMKRADIPLSRWHWSEIGELSEYYCRTCARIYDQNLAQAAKVAPANKISYIAAKCPKVVSLTEVAGMQVRKKKWQSKPRVRNKSGKPMSKYLAAAKYQTTYTKKWDKNHTSYTIENEQHSWIVIDVRNKKVLCESSDAHFTGGLRYILQFPIEWKKYEDCVKWIGEGTIGDLQESFQNLQIGFKKNFLG
jgi:hypothetical protein